MPARKVSMKPSKYISILAVLSSALVIGACGVDEAVDATRSMPDRIDDTNAQIKATNDRITDMSASLDDSLEKLRLLQLVEGKREVLDPKNTVVLFPPSDGMLAGGKKFAEAATAKELMEVTYSWLTLGVQRQVVIQRKQVLVEKAGQTNADGSVSDPVQEWVAEPMNEYNARIDAQMKLMQVRVTAARIVAAFTPDNVVAQIIDEQLMKEGRYKETAQHFLAMRASFIKEFVLESSLFGTKMDSIGSYEEGIDWINRIEFLADKSFLPFLNYSADVSVAEGLSFTDEASVSDVVGKEQKRS